MEILKSADLALGDLREKKFNLLLPTFLNVFQLLQGPIDTHHPLLKNFWDLSSNLRIPKLCEQFYKK